MLICEALRKCLWRARLERETADRRAVIPLRQWRPASIYTRARSLENFSSPSKLYNVRELLTLEKKRPFVCNKRTWSSLSRKLWLARWFSLLENVEFSSQLFFFDNFSNPAMIETVFSRSSIVVFWLCCNCYQFFYSLKNHFRMNSKFRAVVEIFKTYLTQKNLIMMYLPTFYFR